MLKLLFKLLSLYCVFLAGSAHAYNELKDANLTIYVNPSNPPFATLTDDYQTSVGLDIDIIKELQRRLGFKLKDGRVYPLYATDILRKMEVGEADMIGGSLSFTKKRSATMHFTPVYFNSGLGILYSAKYNKGNINKLDDLKGRKISVVADTVGATYINRKDLNASVTEYKNFTRAALSVAYGYTDAFIYDKPILEAFANDMKILNLNVADHVFSRESAQYAFALPKDSPYSEAIDNEIQNMIYDGTMTDIVHRYFK